MTQREREILWSTVRAPSEQIAELCDILRKHLDATGVNRFAQDSLVFTNGRGEPIRRSSFRKNTYRPAAKRAGVDHTTVHHLRHFAASYAADRGFTLVEVASGLGHAADNMTSLYSHTFKDAASAAAGLGALLREPEREAQTR